MKVFTIGETVLDIIFKNYQPVSAKAGGSVLNSSVSLGRLGIDVHFISDYGKDTVGNIIDNFLSENNVNTEEVVKFHNHKSALALAFLDDNNNASYSFYKDFPEKRLEGLSIQFSDDDYLLFGSFFAITEAVRESLTGILNDARNAGTTIIYDPNFRKPHLHELERVKPWIIQNIHFADIIKGSDEDFGLIFDATTPDEAYQHICDAGCENLIYTAGANDIIVKTPGINLKVSVPKIKPVSTIGAGDNFNAGIVYTLISENIHKKELLRIQADSWEKIAKTGVLFASHVCQSYENYISQQFANNILNKNALLK